MIRDEALRQVTSIFPAKSKQLILARGADISSSSEFDARTGARTSGTLDLNPEEILYLAWRQKQPPKSEATLRQTWSQDHQFCADCGTLLQSGESILGEICQYNEPDKRKPRVVCSKCYEGKE